MRYMRLTLKYVSQRGLICGSTSLTGDVECFPPTFKSLNLLPILLGRKVIEFASYIVLMYEGDVFQSSPILYSLGRQGRV